MPRKVSRRKRSYFARGRERFLEEGMTLPIEIWKLIFLFVRNTSALEKVSKSFRTAISDLHFHRVWSKIHEICSIDWCKNVGRAFLLSDGRAKWCHDHICIGCGSNRRRIFSNEYLHNEFCKDCEYICDKDGCENQALVSKSAIHRILTYGYFPAVEKWYCSLHGCADCGRARCGWPDESIYCNICRESHDYEYEY